MPDDQPPHEDLPTLSDLDNAPPAIPVSPRDVQVTTADYANKLAQVTEEKDRLYFENEKLKLNAETARTLNDLIKPFANKAFWFMCGYCGIVGLMVFFHGFTLHGFSLPDSALNFLVGSTAAAVIGLVGMVLTGIFVGARK